MAHAPTDTPRTDAEVEERGNNLIETAMAEFTRSLERQLNEARALLTRIYDGAEPVLMAEEIEEFLDKTEVDFAG